MEPSPAEPAGRSGVSLSAAEAAFLRRFVRRHALPGAAGAAVLAAAMLAIGLVLWPGREAERAEDSAPAAAPAGLAALEGEVGALRATLAERSPAPAPDAEAAVAELARRIEAIAREIHALRARLDSAPRPAPAPAPAPPASDLVAVADRLYQIELRQSETEAGRSKVEGELLARIHGLELRQEERERRDVSALGSLLERMDRLERSRDVAEANRLEGQNAALARLEALESRLSSAPAAPAPR
jgi:hypothetical protein